MNQLNARILPTNEEMRILKERFKNIKDLFVGYGNDQVNYDSSRINIDIGGASTRELINKSSSLGTLINNKSKAKIIGNNSCIYNEGNTIHEEDGEGTFNHTHKNNEKNMSIHPQLNQFNQSIIYERYEELLKENQILKISANKNNYLNNNQTFSEILDDYLKIKSQNAELLHKMEDKDKLIHSLQKENEMLKQVDKSKGETTPSLKQFIISLLYRSYLSSSENKKILTEIFKDTNPDLAFILTNRIEALELQNYYLIHKNEVFSEMMKKYIDEIVEYYDVLCDIKNVINKVFDSQSFTAEFLIIKDTLNNRSQYLKNQKDYYLQEKKFINHNLIKQNNIDILFCKDKLAEIKVDAAIINNNLNNTINSNKSKSFQINDMVTPKLIEIIDEKINLYENIKLNLAQYEDFINNADKINDTEENQHNYLNIREKLQQENFLLKDKNIRLNKIIRKLITNKNISINEDIINEINDVINCRKDFTPSEDLFLIIKSQALMLESVLQA